MPTHHNPSLVPLVDEFSLFFCRLKAFQHILPSLYEQGCSQDEACGFSAFFADLVDGFSAGFKSLEELSKG
jgi:hypothetical protein